MIMRTLSHIQTIFDSLKPLCLSGLDIVLDPLGGSDTQKAFNLLKPMGTLIVYGKEEDVGVCF